MKSRRFEGKVAIVTGASSGIGRATAIALAQEGARTVLVARSKPRLQALERQIRDDGGDALAVATDVTSDEAVGNMLREAMAHYGRVDILFSNAGKASVGPVDGKPYLDDAREMFEVDYLGTARVVRTVLPVMRSQGSGSILTMSSVVGFKAFERFAGYSSVMHAIAGFTDALRQELRGSGISVSIIHPALTQTPLLSGVATGEMPPPFRSLSPIPVERVARAALDGLYKRRPRIVVPSQPRLLLWMQAISPRLGDFLVRMLQHRIASRLLGTYRGHLYLHEHGAG